MHPQIRRSGLAFTITSALVFVGAAQAEPPTDRLPGEPVRNGAHVIENVRFVQAPARATVEPTAAPAPAPTGGMRAYQDENGRLREMTDKDAADAAAEHAAEQAAAAQVRRQARAIQRPAVSTRADGSKMAVLDESTHSYSVAHVDAQGRIVEICVTGEEKAKDALETGAREASNER